LERRPDIREAEQNLVAANAQIGAARALYFPQLSLSAFAGGQSRSLLELASAPARVYSVAPGALQSIFHAGQIRNQVRLSEAQQRELLITYQRSIYTALREVSDALVSFDRLREQRSQEEHLVHTLEETVRLSDLRYRGGLDSYLQVLDAQRNLFNGQLTLAQLRLQERVSVVQLYRALGGGQAGRHLRGNRDLFQLAPARLGRWSAALQQAKLVFALCNSMFGGRDLRTGGVEQLLRLADIETGGRPALSAQFHQIQTVLGDPQGLAADLQLKILFQQLEVSLHHVGDQRNAHRAPAFFAGQIAGARGFGEPAQAAPDIQLPGKGRPQRRVGIA
jgi:hypothetical protein